MACAQVNTDSLLSIWNDHHVPDTLRLKALHQAAFSYLHHAPDSARLLAEIGESYARGEKMAGAEARSLNIIGLSYRHLGDWPRAMLYYEQSLALLQRLGDLNYQAAVYGNMGDIYRLQSNFPQAVASLEKTLSLAEATGDQQKMAEAYVSIATIYQELPEQHEQSQHYLEKARLLYEQTGNEQGLALVYANLASMYADQEDHVKGLFYAQKALEWYEKIGNQYGVATVLFNRAALSAQQGKYQSAVADFERAVTIFRQMGDQEGVADALTGIGSLWLQQGENAKAIRYCGQGQALARKMGSPNLIEAKACYCLYKAHQNQGQYKAAMRYLEQYHTATDSIRRDETATKLKQMELARQSAIDSLAREKEKFRVEMAHQSALRRKDQTAVWLTVLGLLALVVALAVWVRMLYFQRRSARLQQRSEILEKQQLINEIALLKAQVNPHFLFNSLSILTSLVHVSADLSEQFIEQLARSYQYILEQKDESLVTLRTEVEFIQSYAFLLKIRFDNKFVLNIQIIEHDLDQYKIAPLTLQLLVENAVKHNQMSAAEPLSVDIFIERDYLWVKNNLRLRLDNQPSTHTGLKNIISRYNMLGDRPVWAGAQENSFVVRIPLFA